jgi:hypothetical protein
VGHRVGTISNAQHPQQLPGLYDGLLPWRAQHMDRGKPDVVSGRHVSKQVVKLEDHRDPEVDLSSQASAKSDAGPDSEAIHVNRTVIERIEPGYRTEH